MGYIWDRCDCWYNLSGSSVLVCGRELPSRNWLIVQISLTFISCFFCIPDFLRNILGYLIIALQETKGVYIRVMDMVKSELLCSKTDMHEFMYTVGLVKNTNANVCYVYNIYDIIR